MTAAYPAGNAVQRALAVLREEGLASFWFRLASTMGYRRLLLLECSLGEAPPRLEPGLPLQIGVLKESGVDDHVAFRPELPRARLLDRLSSAQECFVARHDGRIVSACWATKKTAWIDYLGCELALAAGEVYLFDAYTLPAYRGQGTAPALCLYQLSHFRGQGLRRAMRATFPENLPALRAHAKSGFRPYAVLRTLKLGPWQSTAQRPWRSGGCRPGA